MPLSDICIGVSSKGELGVAIGCELALADVEADTEVEDGTFAGVDRPETEEEGLVIVEGAEMEVLGGAV